MVPDWLITYWGSGILVIIAYVIVSNTLWLLFGSKMLQILPGVGGIYAISTFRIALMLVLVAVGFLHWLIRYPVSLAGFIEKVQPRHIISSWLQRGGRLQNKILTRIRSSSTN